MEIVRSAFSLWNEGDLDDWDQIFDPEVTVVAPEGWPDGAVSQGFEAWKLQAQRLRDSWEEARIEVDEIRPGARDTVLIRLRYLTRGGDTAIAFDTPMSAVFSVRHGKITRADYFWNVEDALEAAGLSE